jgi:hypothetical protein
MKDVTTQFGRMAQCDGPVSSLCYDALMLVALMMKHE